MCACVRNTVPNYNDGVTDSKRCHLKKIKLGFKPSETRVKRFLINVCW